MKDSKKIIFLFFVDGDYSGDESEHCHDSSDERSILDEKKRRKAMKKLLIATALSCVFMIGEVIGEILGIP